MSDAFMILDGMIDKRERFVYETYEGRALITSKGILKEQIADLKEIRKHIIELEGR